jgi:hypothetical protein
MCGSTGSRGPTRKSRIAGCWSMPRHSARGLLLALAALLVPPSCAAADTGPGVRVLLRYDDYTKTSSFVLEQQLFRGLSRMSVPVLIGAVPFPGAPYPDISATSVGKKADLGPEKVALLRELAAKGHAEVALHGYSHRNNAAAGQRNSEFAGLPLEQQRQLLTLGKTAFEAALDLPVRTFIPPFNAYDDSTVLALERTGFAILSADVRRAQANAAIAFVPGTIYPQKMKQAIRNALREKSGNSLVVVVMHNYDFVGDEQPVPSFRKGAVKIDASTLLEAVRWAKQQPGLTFVSVDDLLRAGEDLSGARVASNRSLHDSLTRVHALLPASLESPSSDGVMLTTSRADALKRHEYLLGLGIYAALFFLTYALSRHLQRGTHLGSHRNVQQRLLLAGGASLALFGYVHGFYLSEAMLLASLAGWYTGLAAPGHSGTEPWTVGVDAA